MASWAASLVRIHCAPYVVNHALIGHLISALLSACTCSGEDHPGPSNSKGRGVPEIDILEVERNKTTDSTGQVVSQSAQFAPFTHDYTYVNDTADAWTIYDPSITRPNDYKGSAM